MEQACHQATKSARVLVVVVVMVVVMIMVVLVMVLVTMLALADVVLLVVVPPFDPADSLFLDSQVCM